MPPKETNFQCYETEVPKTVYSLEFLAALSQKPDLIYSVAVCGHLHHGKTLFCDMVFKQTHSTSKPWDLEKEYKFTDNRKDERDREISLKSSPLTVVMPDSRGKNYLFNFMDTPGHPAFSDEVTCAMRICDGMLLVVDCIEGMTLSTERVIKEALRNDMRIVMLLNKLDRLVLELKLPPNDAYFKLKHTIDDVNSAILKHSALLGKP